MELIKKLKDKGLYVEVFSDKGKLLRVMWENTFLNNISKSSKKSIYLNQFLWHIFSYQKLDCFEKNEAINAFNRIKKQKCYIFYQHNNEAFVLNNASIIKAEDFDNEYDIYIVDKDFTWTYVHTHEKYCGPYFYNKENMDLLKNLY